MDNKILIPLDGSDFSKSILPCVKQFLNPDDCQLCLVQVSERPTGVLDSGPALERDIDLGGYTRSQTTSQAEASYRIYPAQAEESLVINLTTEMTPIATDLEAAGFSVKTDVLFGKPVQALLDYVQTESVTLVALATHGRSGIARALMGSVASALLRQLSVPLLVIHPLDVNKR